MGKPVNMKWIAILLLVWHCAGSLRAQVPGDSGLVPLQLGYEDILEYEPEKGKVIYGANRVPENTDELSVRTYVITNDEIVRNGYTTLNDILRTIPGFRTSTPSHALLGETFLQRGQLGNIYTKILVNGIPISPSAAPGMPIGANLPIKQAERIEIICGPASSVYGNDAMAGVINIVIPEVEHPVEAIANAGISQNGMDEFHLSIGGKAGNAKHVIDYRIFGSSRRMDDRNLLAPDSLYLKPDSIRFPELWKSPSDYPTIKEFGHESRVLGASVGYNGFRFMALRMYRKDHSAIGSHPSEIAYDNPGTFVAENINQLQLQYDKTLGRFWMHTNLSLLTYALDNNSQYEGVNHPISNDKNSMYADSKDYLVEQLLNYRIGDFSFLVGGNLLLRTGFAYQAYLEKPYDSTSHVIDPMGNEVLETSYDQYSFIAPYSTIDEYSLKDLGGFGQVSWHKKRFNITGALRADRPGNQSVVLSPKATGMLKITNGIRIRGMYSQAFRSAGTYYVYNNYRYRKEGNEPTPNMKREAQMLQPERLRSAEGGVVFTIGEHVEFELHYFRHYLENTIFGARLESAVEANDSISPNQFFGFANANSEAILNGFQGFLTYDNGPFRAELSGQYNLGHEFIEGLDSINGYRNVPEMTAKLNLHFNKEEWFRFSVYAQYHGEFIGYLAQVNGNIRTSEVGSYYNVDMMLGKRLSKRLDLYVRARNVTNSVQKGISSDFIALKRLAYIPQERRTYIFGLTFLLN